DEVEMGAVTVTVSTIDDGQVCGAIETGGPGAVGRFRALRGAGGGGGDEGGPGTTSGATTTTAGGRSGPSPAPGHLGGRAGCSLAVEEARLQRPALGPRVGVDTRRVEVAPQRDPVVDGGGRAVQ